MQKRDVLRFYGTPKAAAKALRITRQAVQKWPDRIPELAAMKLERITNGKLKYDEDAYKKTPARDDLTGA